MKIIRLLLKLIIFNHLRRKEKWRIFLDLSMREKLLWHISHVDVFGKSRRAIILLDNKNCSLKIIVLSYWKNKLWYFYDLITMLLFLPSYNASKLVTNMSGQINKSQELKKNIQFYYEEFQLLRRIPKNFCFRKKADLHKSQRGQIQW